MAEVILKNIKKVYPHQEPKKRKKGAEEKKTNLLVTDEGVLAVQDFNLEIKDKEKEIKSLQQEKEEAQKANEDLQKAGEENTQSNLLIEAYLALKKELPHEEVRDLLNQIDINKLNDRQREMYAALSDEIN